MARLRWGIVLVCLGLSAATVSAQDDDPPVFETEYDDPPPKSGPDFGPGFKGLSRRQKKTVKVVLLTGVGLTVVLVGWGAWWLATRPRPAPADRALPPDEVRGVSPPRAVTPRDSDWVGR